MANDFSVFWQNNEQASALFYDLIARAEKRPTTMISSHSWRPIGRLRPTRNAQIFLLLAICLRRTMWRVLVSAPNAHIRNVP